MKKYFVLMACMVTCGCVATGTQLSQEEALQFKKGKTTEKEIVAVLGPPNGVFLANGYKFISYHGASVQVQAQTLLPVVGPFVGGSNSSSSTVNYIIGANGILKDIQYHSQMQGGRYYTTGVKSP